MAKVLGRDGPQIARDVRCDSSDSALAIRGGEPLNGVLRPAGFKHALVTTIAAGCAANAPIVIHNCPRVAEAFALSQAIVDLGGAAQFGEGSMLTIDARQISRHSVKTRTADEVHGTVYLAPGLLGRLGEATVPTGGGCRIGDGRNGNCPVEQYVSVFERFGGRAECDEHGNLRVRARRLRGTDIDLLDYTTDRRLRTGPLYSGATKMALLTASVAYGTTMLHNPYPKPDVTELFEVLRGCGADLEETPAGSYVIRGRGPEALIRPVAHQLPPDLIEVITWICVGALYGRTSLRIEGARMELAWNAIAPERDLLARMGVPLAITGGTVVVYPAHELRSVDILVTSPGIFSDNHPFFSLLAAHARGNSTIRETVWSSRFSYVAGLRALGVKSRSRRRRLKCQGTLPAEHFRTNRPCQ